MTTPIATYRKARFAELELQILRDHPWYQGESPGTIWFKPDQYLTERQTKAALMACVTVRCLPSTAMMAI